MPLQLDPPRYIRRARCDAETTERVRTAIALGLNIQKACALAGITRQSFYVWQQRGREEIASREAGNAPKEDDQAYCDFADTLTRAEMEAEQTFLQRITEAATPHQVRTITSKREAKRDARGAPILDDRGQPVMLLVGVTVVEREEWDWKAALELLSRRFHQDWGTRTRTEISGPDGGPLELTVEERMQRLVEQAKACRKKPARKKEVTPTKEPV